MNLFGYVYNWANFVGMTEILPSTLYPVLFMHPCYKQILLMNVESVGNGTRYCGQREKTLVSETLWVPFVIWVVLNNHICAAGKESMWLVKEVECLGLNAISEAFGYDVMLLCYVFLYFLIYEISAFICRQSQFTGIHKLVYKLTWPVKD